VIGVKRGFTLLETVIAVALLSMCVIGFLEALNVAMLGTDSVRQNNAAAELARSQMEYVQQRAYIVHNDSEQSKYGDVPENPLGLGINTTVYNVSLNGTLINNRAIQQITVRIPYSGGAHYMDLTDYKTLRLAGLVVTGAGGGGWPISDSFNIPTLPCNGPCKPNKLNFCCLEGAGERYGYFYAFETEDTGPISINWWFFNDGETKFVTMYLYGPTSREDFPDDDKGLIRFDKPEGSIREVKSFKNEGLNREICDLEMTGQPAGTYVVYFYNQGHDYGEGNGLGQISWEIPPSQATITYTK